MEIPKFPMCLTLALYDYFITLYSFFALDPISTTVRNIYPWKIDVSSLLGSKPFNSGYKNVLINSRQHNTLTEALALTPCEKIVPWTSSKSHSLRMDRLFNWILNFPDTTDATILIANVTNKMVISLISQNDFSEQL